MHEDRSESVDRECCESPEEYEPPTITLLGTVDELTKGPVSVGGDLNGMVISF